MFFGLWSPKKTNLVVTFTLWPPDSQQNVRFKMQEQGSLGAITKVPMADVRFRGKNGIHRRNIKQPQDRSQAAGSSIFKDPIIFRTTCPKTRKCRKPGKPRCEQMTCPEGPILLPKKLGTRVNRDTGHTFFFYFSHSHFGPLNT